ncbi:unnamed protein product [Linum trigynum]|uniref:Uncharacterized protein n=1 Tax=Linum trigynum TaxID=586398 RepID=A0AAV2E5Q5_9ROSI
MKRQSLHNLLKKGTNVTITSTGPIDFLNSHHNITFKTDERNPQPQAPAYSLSKGKHLSHQRINNAWKLNPFSQEDLPCLVQENHPSGRMRLTLNLPIPPIDYRGRVYHPGG